MTVTAALCLAASSSLLWLACGSETLACPAASIALRHRLHEQHQRLAETQCASGIAAIVTEPHYDQVVRGNDQCCLPAGPRHVIRIPRDRIAPVAIQPEESPINRALIRGPGGCERAD